VVSDPRPLGDDGAASLLRDFAISAEVARRFRGGTELTLLRSVSDAAVVLFGAEACSIAVYDAAENMLEYRVASGPHGTEVVGVRVSPSQGIAGYVFSTGQPLAITDVASDPRFDRSTAEHTGYVPRSIAAVPLIDDETALGVLQVLDKRSTPTFSLRDMELLAVFATLLRRYTGCEDIVVGSPIAGRTSTNRPSGSTRRSRGCPGSSIRVAMRSWYRSTTSSVREESVMT